MTEIDPLQSGRDLFMRNMRKVLRAHGFEGEALETKVQALLQRDVSRIAAVIWGATAAEATKMTIEQRLAFIQARRKDKANG